MLGDLPTREALAARSRAATPSCTSPRSPTSDQVAERPERTEQRQHARHAQRARGRAGRRGQALRLREHDLGLRNARPRPVDEDTPLGLPAHLYTATKLAGEMYCRRTRELYGLEYTILRFGIPYGPRARPAAVVPAFVAKALAGEPLTIAGDGTQTRRFVYVEDLADGVVAALAPGGGEPRLQPRRRRERERARDRRRRAGARRRRADRAHRSARGRLPGGNISGERAAHRARLEAATPSSRACAATSSGSRAEAGDRPSCRHGLEHGRKRGGGSAPGVGRAVGVGVVQEHDVAGPRPGVARRAIDCGVARALPVAAPRRPEERPPAALATSRSPARLKTPYGGR